MEYFFRVVEFFSDVVELSVMELFSDVVEFFSDLQLVTISVTDYFSDVELARRFAVSRVTIWRWSSQGVLPKPVKLGANCSRWRAEEIAAAEDRWLAARAERFGETPHDAAPAPAASPRKPRARHKARRVGVTQPPAEI